MLQSMKDGGKNGPAGRFFVSSFSERHSFVGGACAADAAQSRTCMVLYANGDSEWLDDDPV